MLVAAPPLSLEGRGRLFKQDPTEGRLFAGHLSDSQRDLLARCMVDPARVEATVFANILESIRLCDPRFRTTLGEEIGSGAFDEEARIASASEVPIALCQGTKDAFILPEQVALVRLGRPWRPQPIMFKQSGHSPHLEQPAEFSKLLRQFLNQIHGTMTADSRALF